MKLDNYIYLTICEESFKMFKKTNFSTYHNYCKTFYLSLDSNDLSSREKSDLISLLNILDLIYGLDDKVAFKYIMEFLACNKVQDFELYVREMYNCYPLAFN